MSDTSPPTAPLSYASAAPRNTKLRRRILYLTTAAVVLASSYPWLQQIKLHLQVLYWQHRCVTYAAPPDRVILQLLEIVPESSVTGRSDGEDIPSQWQHFYSLLEGGLYSEGTVFLHARRRNDGTNRLVSVDLYVSLGTTSHPRSGVFLDSRVFQLGTLTTLPREILGTRSTKVADLPQYDLSSNPFRFFAGQPDPADPSHFTIDYEDPAGRHTLDGWLQNDDTILLQPRHP